MKASQDTSRKKQIPSSQDLDLEGVIRKAIAEAKAVE